jgi:hypothetical protein
MRERPNWSHEASALTPQVPTSVSAVVLTHRRPRLATTVVRSLIEREGLSPDRVVVVVNGSGGLDDGTLESSVRLVRLPRNLGPAGGFAAGMEAAFADPSVRWAYLCEDDVGLFSLPSPRLADVMGRVEARDRLPGRPVGAVVAYGRRFVGRGAHTVNVAPPTGEPYELVPVDVASWGATLLARPVFDAGILPDPEWFFGLEDFDFFCRVGQGGFDVLVDAVSARAVVEEQTSAGRVGALAPHRPTDERETWRSYYHARNSVLWLGDTDAPPGTCGMRPTRPGICKWPPETASERPSCTASGMVSGVGSGRTPITAGRWGNSTEPRRSRFSNG